MRNFLITILINLISFNVFANHLCFENIRIQKIVPNTTYPFEIDGEKSCFFAYYTMNPDPTTDLRGTGNTGDAIWYGYYKKSDPTVIYEFPKPTGTDWAIVCNVEAVAFSPKTDEKNSSVEVIGSCNKQNAIHHTFPFVFNWNKGEFVLDKNVYSKLYGLVNLTIADIRAYIRSRDYCYNILRNRGNSDYNGPRKCV